MALRRAPGLDYFQSTGNLTDERLQDAVEVVLRRRLKEGKGTLQQRWPGETWFEMEKLGEPSRWNTPRALRVLDMWRADRPDQF